VYCGLLGWWVHCLGMLDVWVIVRCWDVGCSDGGAQDLGGAGCVVVDCAWGECALWRIVPLCESREAPTVVCTSNLQKVKSIATTIGGQAYIYCKQLHNT